MLNRLICKDCYRNNTREPNMTVFNAHWHSGEVLCPLKFSGVFWGNPNKPPPEWCPKYLQHYIAEGIEERERGDANRA